MRLKVYYFKRVNTIFLLVVLFFSVPVKSQYDEQWSYGVKAGAIYSKLSNIDHMLVRSNTYSGYDLKNKYRLGGSFGVFANYKFDDRFWAIQPELAYTMQGGEVSYSDIEDLHWKVGFKYNYVTISGLVKIYPIGGFNIGLGPSLSLNISDKITYSSNEAPEEAARVRSNLPKVLKSKTDIAMVFNLGYEWENGLSVEGRYSYGLNDVIETQPNLHDISEKTNRNSFFQLTLSYALNFLDY